MRVSEGAAQTISDALLRARLVKPDGYREPIMYDVSIDDYRYVTQADVDLMQQVCGAYGHIAEVVKRHSAKIRGKK